MGRKGKGLGGEEWGPDGRQTCVLRVAGPLVWWGHADCEGSPSIPRPVPGEVADDGPRVEGLSSRIGGRGAARRSGSL